MSTRWERLSRMSDEEVVAAYDDAAEYSSGGLAFWRDEIWRRESARQTTTIRRLTWVLTVLTIAIAVLTAVNVWLVFMAI